MNNILISELIPLLRDAMKYLTMCYITYKICKCKPNKKLIKFLTAVVGRD